MVTNEFAIYISHIKKNKRFTQHNRTCRLHIFTKLKFQYNKELFIRI